MKASLLFSVFCLSLYFVAANEYRILNGQVVQSVTKYPFKCALNHLFNSFQCGCVIISPDYVLTSARCVAVLTVQQLVAHVGSNHISAYGVDVPIDSKVDHFDFMSNDPFSPDLSVLRLAAPLNFSAPEIGAVALPTQGQATPTGSAAVLIGWGYTAQAGPYSPNLMEANATIMDHTACAAAYSSEGIINDRHICTTNQGGGVCNGDNGGPLLINNVLHGLTTWTSNQCATAQGFPGVYTRIAQFRDWINGQTGV